MADVVAPLCTASQFTESAFGDLVAGQSDTAIGDFLMEATRACEDITNRRLAPFTGLTENHRASDIDPDEYSDQSNLPMDIQSTLGASYAQAIGASSLVRKIWVDECAPRYADLWQYSDVSVTIVRSYGGTQQLQSGQILKGPDPDTGFLWFQLGLFLPVASMVQVTYSGGYQTSPASLSRACKYVTASIAITELNPATEHDPEVLMARAEKWLEPFGRD